MAACRMIDMIPQHIPVMINEVIEHLLTTKEGVYIDATFGRGSHSLAILETLSPHGRLIAFDKDLEAVEYAKRSITDPRFTIIHDSFANLYVHMGQLNLLGAIDGILFDLGVSSPQLDQAERGFSFMREGFLDMRMDTTKGVTAQQWLATVDENELANVLWQFGEERFSRRIAKTIVAAREQSPITTTTQLAELIKKTIGRKGDDKHPATRSFQAIRIAINEELSDLQKGLQQAVEVLKEKGRLGVISFHSLEDRIVKQFIRLEEKGHELPRGLPIKAQTVKSRLKTIVKGMKPSQQEINTNPRARSAILRIAEKQP